MRQLPKRFEMFTEEFPDVAEAYRVLGDTLSRSGPLDQKTICLIKIGMSVGSGQEGATRSHTRKAIDAGATREEIRHAVIVSVTTLGFPMMMRGLSWVDDVLSSEVTNGSPELD